MFDIRLKPVCWSTNGYRRPCGSPSSGHVADYGYGGEEWNGLKRLNTIDGRTYFHVEAKGLPRESTPEQPNLGLIMISSHKGKQYAVGVALDVEATREDEKDDILKGLSIDRRWEDAWKLVKTRGKFSSELQFYKKKWTSELGHLVNFSSPSSLFETFKTPVALDPEEITGKSKSKFSTRFGGSQKVTRKQALFILERALPSNHKIIKYFDTPDAEVSDLDSFSIKKKIELLRENDTRIIASIALRRGQAAFRRELLRAYLGKCQVTGCAVEALLEAAHIVPYAKQGQYHLENGLLLRSDIHVLFDLGLMAIAPESYAIEISPLLRKSEYWKFNGRILSLPEWDDACPPSSERLLERAKTYSEAMKE